MTLRRLALNAAAAILAFLATAAPPWTPRPLALGPEDDAAPKTTEPPGEESEAMNGLIVKAPMMIEGGMTPSDILKEPHFLPAHEYPRFREIIKAAARPGPLTIVTPDEPGPPLVVTGTVRNASGQPVKGVLVYLYQTSAKGWYSDRAPHYAADMGDEKHARLFGYLRTDDRGGYEVHTIRPSGYPGSDLPGHIHVEIFPEGAGARPLISEIRFEDDPRMTPAMTERSKQEGFIVATVTRAKGAERVTADFTLR